MYISLNKKIFYALFLLLIIVAVLFLTIFLRLYSEKYEESQNLTMTRNRYIVELLQENISLQRSLSVYRDDVDVKSKEKELTREKEINEQLLQNYDQHWAAFKTGGKIIGLSSLLSLFLIITLGFLLKKWVIVPVQKLAEVSRQVANGDYSSRIKLDEKRTFDELDVLTQNFNSMIAGIERNIAEIKNTEVFLQSLIDAIPDGIRVIDRDYNIVMVNKAYLKQTEDKSLQKCYDVYGCNCPCLENVTACPFQYIKHGNAKSVNIIHNLCGRPLSINAAPLKIHNSAKSDDFYIVEVMRDLSEDIRFSHEQKIASLGFLATSVAHEMKNNLGAVRMILEGLLNTDSLHKIEQSEKDKYLQMIYKQIVSSIEMPERLLQLARGSGDEKELIQVNSCIAEVLSLLDYEAKRNGISIEHYNQATESIINGNATDFKMIILNLAQNAFKAMPAGGHFRIGVSKNRNQILIEFEDTGIGIPKEKISHIFEPFYSQGHYMRRKGTGLGLAIVKNLVEKFKGNIEVSSIVDKGTTFLIKIPRYRRNNLQS